MKTSTQRKKVTSVQAVQRYSRIFCWSSAPTPGTSRSPCLISTNSLIKSSQISFVPMFFNLIKLLIFAYIDALHVFNFISFPSIIGFPLLLFSLTFPLPPYFIFNFLCFFSSICFPYLLFPLIGLPLIWFSIIWFPTYLVFPLFSFLNSISQ